MAEDKNSNNNRPKSSKNKRTSKLWRIFITTAFITLVVVCLCGAALVYFYNSTIRAESKSQIPQVALTPEEEKFEEVKKQKDDINRTIAVFGVDEDETRTDVVFIVNFNTKTNKVKVLSIPRDTKVIWSDKQRRAYTELTGGDIAVSKLNEMSAYGRINQNVGNIRDFTVDELENIIKEKIDNYIVINLEAFTKIVQAIDGVDMYVPQRMYYTDYSQGLYIDLDEGMQHLDPDKAEQLVRFRRYQLGDEQRVRVQQEFLKAVAKKVLSPSQFKKLPTVITKLFPYVKTDIKLTDVLKYIGLLENFNLDGLEMYVVPGFGDDYEGPSYYYIDEAKLDETLDDIFNDTTVNVNEGEDDASGTEADVVEDKTVTIAVYNATGKDGIAGEYKDALECKGYNVVRIANEHKSHQGLNTIYAKDRSKAKQFLPYIPGAQIVTDPNLDYDISIVIGYLP